MRICVGECEKLIYGMARPMEDWMLVLCGVRSVEAL
jgi:hypothetical protein